MVNGSAPVRLRQRLRETVHTPEFVTDLTQITKCTVAATLAWWVSVALLDSKLPFLAPWTALLTVHATVYRSLARGAQTAVASTVGVALSFTIGHFLGVSLWTFALALVVGLVGSRLTWLRAEGVAIATTAIFVLGSGFSSKAVLLDDRLLEVGLGIAIGVVVNLALVPPLRDKQAARFVDSINRRMGGVLISMADELESSWDTDRADVWLEETVSLDRELESAWQTVRFAHESQRMNPRTLTPGRPHTRRRQQQVPAVRQVGYDEILARVGEGISHLRNLTRTVNTASHAGSDWNADFRRQWVSIIRDAGHAIQDPDAEVEPVHDRLTDLSQQFATLRDREGDVWPIYGSLITSMRHIAVIVDDVASARQAREEPASGVPA